MMDVLLSNFDQRMLLETYERGDAWPYLDEIIEGPTRLRARMIELAATGLSPALTASYMRETAGSGPPELEESARDVSPEMVERCRNNFSVGMTELKRNAFESLQEPSGSELRDANSMRIIFFDRVKREKTKGFNWAFHQDRTSVRCETPEEIELRKSQIRKALLESEGSQTGAAKLMGISRNTLYRNMVRWPELRSPAKGRPMPMELRRAIRGASGSQRKAAKLLGIGMTTFGKRIKRQSDLWLSIQKEQCTAFALQCQARGQFQQQFSSRYQMAKRHGWLDEITRHMPTDRREVFKIRFMKKYERVLQMWESGRSARNICKAVGRTRGWLSTLINNARKIHGLFSYRRPRQKQMKRGKPKG